MEPQVALWLPIRVLQRHVVRSALEPRRGCAVLPIQEGVVKRIALVIPAFVCCALVAKRGARRGRRADFAKRIAAKPDGTPAKWIFTNVTAIRENTERILELL